MGEERDYRKSRAGLPGEQSNIMGLGDLAIGASSRSYHGLLYKDR